MAAGIIKDYRYQVKKMYGIFIGIDNSMVKGLSTLKGCVNDARGLKEGFNITPEPVFLTNGQATRSAIFKALSDYMNKVPAKSIPSYSGGRGALNAEITGSFKGELLVISISCHGMILPETQEFVLVPVDFDEKNRLGTCISTITLINACSTIASNGGKVLLLLDCCHAGGINFDISKFSNILSQGGIACISSSSAKELSIEKSFGGQTHGLFSYHLIEGLSGKADISGQKFITLRDWFDYAYEKVIKTPNNKQYPVMIGTLDGQTVIKKLTAQ